jgi:hypothetical protein
MASRAESVLSVLSMQPPYPSTLGAATTTTVLDDDVDDLESDDRDEN